MVEFKGYKENEVFNHLEVETKKIFKIKKLLDYTARFLTVFIIFLALFMIAIR